MLDANQIQSRPAARDKIVDSRTELDSHANMPVIGKHAFVISYHGKTADVSPFTPDYEPMVIEIVDAAVLYECPYTGKEYILVICNVLHVPSMNNNLLPPFILCEQEIQVNVRPVNPVYNR